MGGGLSYVSEYELTDELSSAGAAIGVIVAGTIFLQFTSTKCTDLCSRYRALTEEDRGRSEEEPRHGSLQSQIRFHKLVGTVGLFGGLILTAGAVRLELAEIPTARHEFGDEPADLDDHIRIP